MQYFILRILYVLVVVFAFGTSIREYLRNPGERKIILLSFLLGFTLLSELINFIPHCPTSVLSLKYYIFSFLELLLISWYFKMSDKARMPAFVIVNITSLLFLVFCYWHYGEHEQFPATYIMFEGFCIMIMAIYSLFKIAIAETERKLTRDFDFWIWLCILGLWSLTYFFLGLYNFVKMGGGTMAVVGIADWVVNTGFYLFIGILLLKKRHLHESK